MLADGQETGPVANSTNNIGSVYGVTVGERFNEKVGLQADMTIRTASISQETRATFYQNGCYNVDGTVGTAATVIEMPLLFTLSKPMGENFRPIIGIGARPGFRMSTSNMINGTVTKLDGEGAGQSAPISGKGASNRFSDEPIIGISAIAGGDYKFTEDWSVRGELRFQHDFLNDCIGAYQIGSSRTLSPRDYVRTPADPGEYRVVPSVRVVEKRQVCCDRRRSSPPCSSERERSALR